MTPDSLAIAAYLELLKNGSFIDVVIDHFFNSFTEKFDFQVGDFGRAYLTLAYFQVGMVRWSGCGVAGPISAG